MKIKKYIPILEYMHGLSKKKQKQFLEHSGGELLLIISEICYNINSGNFELSTEQLKKLKPYRRDIEYLCKKSRTIAQRRQRVQKGGMLNVLLSTILPVLLSTLFPYLSS